MLTGHYTNSGSLSPAILSFGENHRESKGSRVLFMLRCGGWSFGNRAKCADVQSACCPMSVSPWCLTQESRGFCWYPWNWVTQLLACKWGKSQTLHSFWQWCVCVCSCPWSLTWGEGRPWLRRLNFAGQAVEAGNRLFVEDQCLVGLCSLEVCVRGRGGRQGWRNKLEIASEIPTNGRQDDYEERLPEIWLALSVNISSVLPRKTL